MNVELWYIADQPRRFVHDEQCQRVIMTIMTTPSMRQGQMDDAVVGAITHPRLAYRVGHGYVMRGGKRGLLRRNEREVKWRWHVLVIGWGDLSCAERPEGFQASARRDTIELMRLNGVRSSIDADSGPRIVR